MEDNKYLSKYLKYKQKYLTAKNQIGGAFAFDNTAFFYIMAVITGNTLDRVNQRRTILGLTGSAVLHLTLLHLHVNLDNPAHVILVDPKFIELIGSAFQKYIKKPNVKLESILQNQSGKIMGGVWEFLGQPSFDSKFWARIYSLPHEFTENYSNFRREIYGYINSKLGVSTMYHREEQKGSGTDIQTFEIFYTPDHQPLYGMVKKFYYGIDNWKPHISVLRINEIKQLPSLNKLYTALEGTATDDARTSILKKTIGSSVEPMSIIDTQRDIAKLKISFNKLKTHSVKDFDIDV